MIDVWPDSSVNFLRFLTVVGLIYFDWWIYFSFFFLGREKESKFGSRASYFRFSIFILFVGNFLIDEFDTLKKIGFSFEIFK